MLVHCPSGLQFTARPWEIGDIISLVDAKEAEAGLLPLRMAELAAETCREPGPYGCRPGGRINWFDVSIADLTSANIQIRAKTRPIFEFDRNCESCGRLQRLQIDLREVKHYEASELGKGHLSSGAPWALELETQEGKARVELKILRGKDLAELAKRQTKKKPSEMIDVQAMLCIQSISFLDRGDAKPITNFNRIREFWMHQPWEFGDAVRDAIDDAEGGPDSLVESQCENIACRREALGSLPLDSSFYGLDPLRTLQRRRSRSSGQISLEEDTPT